MNFQYFLSGKEGLIVISMKGDLDESAGPQLKKCLEDAVANSPTGAVVHMAEASIPRSGFREFSLFLRELKSKCKFVRIASLAANTKADLIQGGLVGPGEVRDTLVDALKEVAAQIRNQSR